MTTSQEVHTYTHYHSWTGFPIYTRETQGDESVTYWHPSGRVTRERVGLDGIWRKVTDTTDLPPLFGEGDCDGDGWIIENPDWPQGDRPYRLHCSGCQRCEPPQA